MTGRWRLAMLLLAVIALAEVFPAAVLAQGAPSFVATVTNDGAALRKNASETGTKIGSASKGEKLSAYGLSPDKKWVKVKAPEGTAWISRADVKVTKAGAPEPMDTPRTTVTRATPKPVRTPVPKGAPAGAKKFALVIVLKTNVLLNPTKSSPTVAVARKDDVFEVGGFSGDKMWVKVRTEDGRIGWIAKTAVKPTQSKATAVAAKTPRPKATPKSPGGFEDTGTFAENGDDDDDEVEPPPPRKRPKKPTGDTRVWADGGVILIHQIVRSKEGPGYDLQGMGYGAGVRYERRLTDSIFFGGGYLGAANQRLKPPNSTATVFSTLHRIDADIRYKYFIGGEEEDPSIQAIAGYQNYTFLVQPQNESWFYTNIYNSLGVGLGGEYGFMDGTLRVAGDFRYYLVSFAGQRYGSGEPGGYGQTGKADGFNGSGGLSVNKVFYSGATLGLGWRGHFYKTNHTGEGKLGPNRSLHEMKVRQDFNAITLTFARGF